MKNKWVWVLLVLMVAGSGICMAADEIPDSGNEGRIVAKIDYVGLININPATLQYAIKTQIGKPFNEKALNRDIVYLKETGYFVAESINTELLPLPGNKINVIIRVQEKPLIQKVLIEGSRYSSKRLMEKINVKDNTFYDKYLVKRDEELLKLYYEEKGYYNADISHRTEPLEKNRVNLIFHIKEEYKVTVGQVHFVGNKWVTDKELLKFMKTRPRKFFTAARYVPQLLEMDLENIVRYYRSLGFLDVKVESEDAKEIGGKPGRKWHKQNVGVTIKVTEGERYRVGRILIEGNKVCTAEQIRERIFLLEDGFYSRKIIFEDTERIKNMYGDEGRIFTRVNVRDIYTNKRTEDKSPVVDVSFVITEAPKTVVEEIRVIGNTKTRTNVILREMEVYKGQIFNRTRLLKSEQNIKNLGLFKKVKVIPIRSEEDIEKERQREAVPREDRIMLPAEEEAKPEDGVGDKEEKTTKGLIIVEVEEEEKTGTVVFGVGAGGSGNVFGAISISQRNFDFRRWFRQGEKFPFQGAGQKFNLSTQFGTLEQQYTLSFYNPYIFDKPYHFGFGVSHGIFDRDDEEFKEKHSRGYISIGRKFYDKKWDVTLTYGYDLVNIYDIDRNKTAQSVIDLEGDTTISMFTVSANYSSLDSPFVPTRGLLFEIAEDFATKALGGDSEFFRTRLDFNVFRPLYTNEEGFSHVIQFRTRIGTMNGNDDDIPMFERFFAGGITTVRGFYSRSLGPKDEHSNPLGGEFKTIFSLEYTFPIFGNDIRGAVFVDGGQVFTEASDFSISDFRYAAGIGMHIVFKPLGPNPIKIYFCKILDKEDGDDEEVFQFMFGFKF